MDALVAKTRENAKAMGIPLPDELLVQGAMRHSTVESVLAFCIDQLNLNENHNDDLAEKEFAGLPQQDAAKITAAVTRQQLALIEEARAQMRRLDMDVPDSVLREGAKRYSTAESLMGWCLDQHAVFQIKTTEAPNDAFANATTGTNKSESMPWVKSLNENGDVLYWNVRTDETAWAPAGVVAIWSREDGENNFVEYPPLLQSQLESAFSRSSPSLQYIDSDCTAAAEPKNALAAVTAEIECSATPAQEQAIAVIRCTQQSKQDKRMAVMKIDGLASKDKLAAIRAIDSNSALPWAARAVPVHSVCEEQRGGTISTEPPAQTSIDEDINAASASKKAPEPESSAVPAQEQATAIIQRARQSKQDKKLAVKKIKGLAKEDKLAAMRAIDFNCALPWAATSVPARTVDEEQCVGTATKEQSAAAFANDNGSRREVFFTSSPMYEKRADGSTWTVLRVLSEPGQQQLDDPCTTKTLWTVRV